MRTDVLGVGFDNLTMDEAVLAACGLMEEGRAACVVTPNPEIVWMSRRDAAFKKALTGADLVLADGIGIILGARILGRPLREKIPGIEFAEALLKRISPLGKSVYLLGAKSGVAQMAAAYLTAAYPGLTVAGTADGYFKEDGPVVDAINAAAPDFLMVCLGAPKQERFMAENRGRLKVGLMAGLGGSLDVFAGTARRAPASWRRLHLEWLYRLLKNPSRITRTVRLPLFLAGVVRQRLTGG